MESLGWVRLFLAVVLSHIDYTRAANLITIGPGIFPSNKTLDGKPGSILVLGSCEFMHNGTLVAINAYVASNDSMIIQIWRPIANPAELDRMQLVYSKLLKPAAFTHSRSIRVQFNEEIVSVQAGDRIGLVKLNTTLPVAYTIQPELVTNTWIREITHDASGSTLPSLGDILDFEETGIPHIFSMVVIFKAHIQNGLHRYRNSIEKISSGNMNNNNRSLVSKNKEHSGKYLKYVLQPDSHQASVEDFYKAETRFLSPDTAKERSSHTKTTQKKRHRQEV